MKTLQQIQQMKNANLEQIRLMGVPSDAQKSEYRRLKKEVEFLLIIEMYLESKPAPEFVKK